MNLKERIKNYNSNYLFPVLAIIFSSIFVWGAFLYSRQETRVSLPPGAVTELHPAIARPVTKEELEKNIATYSLSDITTVEETVIDEITNQNRKIITPKTEQDREKIKQIIEEKGGVLVADNQSTLVVEIPEEKTKEISQELEKENVSQGIEVDHPIYILGETDLWNLAKVDAPRAWEKTKGAGVKVGVIDTGVDYTHPELSGRFAGGYDNVNEDDDPFDGHGHGTHVAGIIASSLDNAGVAGVSPEVSLYAYKAIADTGVGYTSDLIESIDSAINDGMNTINISLGTDQPSAALENKLNQAVNQGMVIVAAAGNTGGGAVLYPAAYDSVISVAATDENDQFASFSSLGAEISAPGVNVLSTVPGGGYATLSGTSMAAPHVTATSALLIANGTSAVRQTIYDSATDLGSEGPDGIFGYGLVQTGESIIPSSPSPTPELPSPTPSEEPVVEASPSPTIEATASASPSPLVTAPPSASPDVNESSPSSKSARPIINRRTQVDDSWFNRIFRRTASPSPTAADDNDQNENPSVTPSPNSKTNQGQDEEHRNTNSYENPSGDVVQKTVRTIFKTVTDIIKNNVENSTKKETVQPSPSPAATENEEKRQETIQEESRNREREDEQNNGSREREERTEEIRERYQELLDRSKNNRGSVRGATTELSIEEKVFDLVWDWLEFLF